MPATPTGLTLTPAGGGSPLATLAWSHDGVDLHRFEVLRKLSGEAIWTSFVIATAASFGAGPYSMTVAAPVGCSWAVRALNESGEVSA